MNRFWFWPLSDGWFSKHLAFWQADASKPLELGRLLDAVAEGFLILDPRLRITYANEAISQILGVSRHQLLRRSIDSLGWQSSAPTRRHWTQGSGEEELMSYRRGDSRQQLLAVTVRTLDERCFDETQPSEFPSAWKVVSVRDATAMETYRAEMENLLARIRVSRENIRQDNERLQHLIQQDALTGCRNRRALDEQAQVSWESHRRECRDLACLMFDIDHFKSFNDDHGHATGDEVLRRFGGHLLDTFAGVGQVYRYGGEEFCVLLPGHGLVEALWIAERVRASVGELQIISQTDAAILQITVSIGVSDRHGGANNAAGMIDQADRCLYIAKRKGRNCVVPYGEEVVSVQFRRDDERRS